MKFIINFEDGDGALAIFRNSDNRVQFEMIMTDTDTGAQFRKIATESMADFQRMAVMVVDANGA